MFKREVHYKNLPPIFVRRPRKLRVEVVEEDDNSLCSLFRTDDDWGCKPRWRWLRMQATVVRTQATVTMTDAVTMVEDANHCDDDWQHKSRWWWLGHKPQWPGLRTHAMVMRTQATVMTTEDASHGEDDWRCKTQWWWLETQATVTMTQ